MSSDRLTSKYFRQGRLKDEWDKTFHSLPIGRVFVGELVEHDFFFPDQFAPEARKHDRHGIDVYEISETRRW
jgi:hypothetical protein